MNSRRLVSPAGASQLILLKLILRVDLSRLLTLYLLLSTGSVFFYASQRGKKFPVLCDYATEQMNKYFETHLDKVTFINQNKVKL